MEIRLSGEKLTDKQKFVLTNLLAGFHFANHTQLLELNLKTYKREGERKKWDAHIKASTDFGFFTAKTITSRIEHGKRTRVSSQAGQEWRFNVAVKKALRKLEEQVESAKTKRIEKGAKP